MDRTNIKTFNSAKKFAEEILHPLMVAHKDARIRSKLGASSIEEAGKLTSITRVWNRFNAMKERIILNQSLLTEVESTIRGNKRRCEVEIIEILSKRLSSLEDSYEERMPEIIIEYSRKLSKVPKLTPVFKQIGQSEDRIYVKLTELMTKNKLLFFGGEDEFMDDEELMEKIKMENRAA